MTSKKILVKSGSVQVPIYSRVKTVEGKPYRVFEVADYSQGGRRLLSFSNKKRAMAEARRVAKFQRNGKASALTLDSRHRDEYVRAKRHLRATGMALDAVAAQYAEAWRKLGGNHLGEAVDYFTQHNPKKFPEKSVGQAVADFINTKRGAGRSHRHLQDLDYRLNKFAKAFPSQLIDVRGADIQAWLAGLGLSGRSKEHFRNKVGALFRWAKRQKYLPSDWDEMNAVEPVKVVAGDVTTYTPGEMMRLLSAADKKFLPALALQAFAGLRTAEVERLKWEDVNFENKVITVSATNAKTKSRRTVPIEPNLIEWLKTCSARSGMIWKGGRTTICNAQSVTAAATATDKLKALGWRHNALRHSYISYRLALVKNANQVALEAGNTPAMIHGHYKELVSEAAAKAWFDIKPNQAKE